NIPAITITAAFKVRLAGMRGKRIGEHLWTDEFFGIKRQVPFKEIGNRRINTAVAQYRAGDALIAQFPAACSIDVTISVIRDAGESCHVGDRIRHAQRIKNLLFHERWKSFPGNTFHDQREQRISGIAVMKLRAGRKISFALLSQNKKYIAVIQWNRRAIWNVIFIIRKAGSVGEQMIQTNRFAVRWELGKKFRQMIFQRKLPLLGQNKYRHGCELLRD